MWTKCHTSDLLLRKVTTVTQTPTLFCCCFCCWLRTATTRRTSPCQHPVRVPAGFEACMHRKVGYLWQLTTATLLEQITQLLTHEMWQPAMLLLPRNAPFEMQCTKKHFQYLQYAYLTRMFYVTKMHTCWTVTKWMWEMQTPLQNPLQLS